MKTKINIRKYFDQAEENKHFLLAHVSLDVDDLFETNDIAEEQKIDIDIHELLRQNRQIAHLWGTEDVLDVRPDLTDDQAWQALQECDRRLDSTLGITWDSIAFIADDLFGPAPESDETEE